MPPPPYPPLCGAKAKERGVVNNLMASFVTMAVDLKLKLEPARFVEEEVEPSAEGESESCGHLATLGAATGVPPECETAGAAAAASADSEVGYGEVMDVEGFVRWLSNSEGAGQ